MDQNTEDEEGRDQLTPLCTCGQLSAGTSSATITAATGASNESATKKSPKWLESSFVHLVAPRRRISPEQQHHHHHHSSAHGFLEQHLYLEQLVAAAKSSDPAASDETSLAICNACIERVTTALSNDTHRLYGDVAAYEERIQEAQHRTKSLFALQNSKEAELTYQQEIALLEQEVAAREAELAHLQSLLGEQRVLTSHLEEIEWQHQTEQNALELQSRAFDHSLHDLSKPLSTVQGEVNQLMMVELPQTMFTLQVFDEQRGLRYPLINELRLAYRPKGDVPLEEIQVAWSQATQLLLSLASLLEFHYPWKLVPLADCAKIVVPKQEIFNLSPGNTKSLLAWNALLDQVVHHAAGFEAIIPPPFESSSHSMGATDLLQLDPMDHVGWSQAIHRMACNLQWLSQQTAQIVRRQVTALAHSVAVE